MDSSRFEGNEPPTQSGISLDYSRPTPSATGRMLINVALGLAVLMLFSAVGWRMRGRLQAHWIVYADQRGVEAVIAPPGAVLFSEAPAEIARLTVLTQYELVSKTNAPTLPAIERVAASFRDPEHPGGSYRSGMAPIGLRRVPGGPWRLINVSGGQYGVLPDGSRNFLFPQYDVLTRGTFWEATRPKQLWYGTNGLSVAPTDRVTLSSGTLDSSDESHFTFDYTINSLAGTVDGYLGKDDNVTFTIRTGPATTRPYKLRSGRQAWP